MGGREGSGSCRRSARQHPPVQEAVDSSDNSSPLAILMASCGSALRKWLTQAGMDLRYPSEAELLTDDGTCWQDLVGDGNLGVRNPPACNNR
jgi:hypothetical protein